MSLKLPAVIAHFENVYNAPAKQHGGVDQLQIDEQTQLLFDYCDDCYLVTIKTDTLCSDLQFEFTDSSLYCIKTIQAKLDGIPITFNWDYTFSNENCYVCTCSSYGYTLTIEHCGCGCPCPINSKKVTFFVENNNNEIVHYVQFFAHGRDADEIFAQKLFETFISYQE